MTTHETGWRAHAHEAGDDMVIDEGGDLMDDLADPDPADGPDGPDFAFEPGQFPKKPGTALVVDTALEGEVVDDGPANTPANTPANGPADRSGRGVPNGPGNGGSNGGGGVPGNGSAGVPGNALARRPDTGGVIRWSRPANASELLPVAGRAVLRGGVYVWAGAVSTVKRRREDRTRLDRLMRQAEQERDLERYQELRQLAEQAKRARHTRRKAWLDKPQELARTAGWLIGGAVAALVVAGGLVAWSYGDLARFTEPFTAAAGVLRFVFWVAGVLWVVAPFALVAGTLVWLAREGRKEPEATPAWMQTPKQQEEVREAFAVINEDMLTRALANCNEPKLNKALRRGEKLYFDVLPRQQGGGTYVQIRLPFGCVAKDFLHPDRIERLAGNLGRHKHEVYPQRQPDADARVLDLWIADQGTMDKPAPPWPLLSDGEFDVFRDKIPWGVTPRGEQVEQGVLARHGLIGAVSKQGKTATLRIHALAVSLDPTTELRIADLKGDGDWSMFEPRAHTLIEGSAEEQTEATCVMLEELVNEMMRRYDRKRELGVRGDIPRALSRRPGSNFHPIFAYVDECQVLYQEKHPVGGTKADARGWRAAKRLHDQARAVNIHLWQATQRPDPTAIPAPVREGAHVRISLYVANYQAAKMVVADAADMGARPQDLRPGRDRGTFVATGEFDGIPEGMAMVIVKGHHVDTPGAYPVIERAMVIMRNHGHTPADQQKHAIEPAGEQPVDHMAVIAEVLTGRGIVKVDEVLHLLVQHDPATYTPWTSADLKKALGGDEAPGAPYKTRNGSMHVSEKRVYTALNNRETATESDENG